MLITSSKTAGRSTGISAVLLPARIRTTYAPARWNMRGRLGPYDSRPPASTWDRYTNIAGSRCFLHGSSFQSLRGLRVALLQHRGLVPNGHPVACPMRCLGPLHRVFGARRPVKSGRVGELIMKTRILVFVIGSATAFLGCAIKQTPEESFQHVRLIDYRSTDTTSASNWNGAVTVNPDRVFGN